MNEAVPSTWKNPGRARRASALAYSCPDVFLVDDAPRPPDPARVAARLLLAGAMAEAGVDADEVAADGTVCLVLLPATCWGGYLREEWRAWFREDEHPVDGWNAARHDSGSWVAWLARKAPRARDADEAGDAFAGFVAQGRHCVGISPDPAWLPADLVHAADHRLTLRVPTGADIATLAAELCGDRPATSLTDDEAALLTPRHLRLARRPGQVADAYLGRLRGLLARERATTACSTARVVPPRAEPVLERLHGMDEAVAWGTGVARDLEAYRAGRVGADALDAGCLLSGPPGCGKTLFARALAATCGVPLVTGSYGQWHGSGGAHQGDLLKAMKATFAEARRVAPCILFIDEVDSFPNRSTIRNHYVEWETQVVNALLAEMDGVEARPGVVLLAACNHPDRLDPALVRSGRLDRHVRIGLPDRTALADILREQLGGDLDGVDLSGVALLAAGATGADCERFVRGARRRAREAGRPVVLDDLLAEVDGSGHRDEMHETRVAVHEAGHAVATCVLEPGALRAVTLRSDRGAGGMTLSGSGSPVWLAADVEDRLVCLLAGRAAEEFVLGRASAGAGGGPESDLAAATLLATASATALGFDATAGLLWSGMPDPGSLQRTFAADPVLAARVRVVLDEAYRNALALVDDHRVAVEEVAAALLRRRALDGEEVEGILVRRPRREGVR